MTHPTTPSIAAQKNPGIERWLWTELLAFDIDQPDYGVSAYISALGFVPEGISLLISSPDFVLLHDGLESDAELPASFCTRFGHPGNEVRQRQPWHRFQLKELITLLRQKGTKVFFSNFPEYQHNKFHTEWASHHPEALIPMACDQYPDGHGPSIYALSRLADGQYFRDVFAGQLGRVCRDYEFDGWHGPDCFCGHNPLTISSCDDGMIDQFVEWGARELPPIVLQSCENKPHMMRERVNWLWEHRRLEWIDFHGDQWANFWKAVCATLHADGRLAFVNSAWTRDPFEAMYRLGFDYRKVVEAGVDAIVVETVAGGLMLYEDKEFHYEYLSMLMHIKACVPDTKLIFLHSIKDVVENWDLLRHAPPLFEREVYALSNVFHLMPSGELVRDVAGPMCCLADGISAEEWNWIADRWSLAFEPVPAKVLGAAFVWVDGALDRFLEQYPTTRIPSNQRLTHLLIENNATISLSVNISSIERTDCPLVVLNPHTLSQEEKEKILASGKIVVAIGPDFSGWPAANEAFTDHFTEYTQQCRVYGGQSGVTTGQIGPSVTSEFPADPLNAEEPLCFQKELLYRPVSDLFLKRCAEVIRRLSGVFSVTSKMASILDVVDGEEHSLPPTHYVTPGEMKIGTMIRVLSADRHQIAIKNSENKYSYPQLTMLRDIASVEIRSLFPTARIFPKGNKMSLILPPRGIVVVDVTFCPR